MVGISTFVLSWIETIKMTIRSIFFWLLEHIHHYNVFIPDENDYDDDDDDEVKDPAVILKHQLYSTQLYIPLLISKCEIHCDSFEYWFFLLPPSNLIYSNFHCCGQSTRSIDHSLKHDSSTFQPTLSRIYGYLILSMFNYYCAVQSICIAHKHLSSGVFERICEQRMDRSTLSHLCQFVVGEWFSNNC